MHNVRSTLYTDVKRGTVITHDEITIILNVGRAHRKMMKISWKMRKCYKWQLYVVPTIKKRKITYFGHVIRRNDTHRLILEGNITIGMSRTVTNITEWTGMRYEDLMRLAQDREQWRVMAAHLIDEDSA